MREDYAYWVNVKLEAFANDLKGSTASAVVIFNLPGAGDDYTNEKISPPGNPSPFGTSTSCYVDLTVTPVSSSQMALTWQKSATANHYHVYRNGINICRTPRYNTYFDTGLSQRHALLLPDQDGGCGGDGIAVHQYRLQFDFCTCPRRV